MLSTDQSNPLDRKILQSMPLFGPSGFLNWDNQEGIVVYLGGKIRPFTRTKIHNILIKNEFNATVLEKEFIENTKPIEDCAMCCRPISKLSIATSLCSECYSYWIEIMQNTGDHCNLPMYFENAGFRYHNKSGKSIFIHFKPSQKGKILNIDITEKIQLGIRKKQPYLKIGKKIITINPTNDYVEISQTFTARGNIAKIDVYIHDTIKINDVILEGCFSNCALVGKTVCERAFLGECLSMNNKAVQWPTSEDEYKNYDIKMVDLAYPDHRINEIIVPPGVIGFPQKKSTNITRSSAYSFINVIDLCPRCADVIALTKKINFYNLTEKTNKKSESLEKDNTNQTEKIEKPEKIEKIEKPEKIENDNLDQTEQSLDTITVPKDYLTSLLNQLERFKKRDLKKTNEIKSLKVDLTMLKSRFDMIKK